MTVWGARGRGLRRHVGVALAAGLLAASLSGCVAAPLMEGFLRTQHERVPIRTPMPTVELPVEPTDPAAPTESPGASDALPTADPAAPSGETGSP